MNVEVQASAECLAAWGHSAASGFQQVKAQEGLPVQLRARMHLRVPRPALGLAALLLMRLDGAGLGFSCVGASAHGRREICMPVGGHPVLVPPWPCDCHTDPAPLVEGLGQPPRSRSALA